MTKPSEELVAMREAMNAYLKKVLVDGDSSRSHDMNLADAYMVEALRCCLDKEIRMAAEANCAGRTN